MFESTRPAPLERGADGTDPFAAFRIEHPSEILALLRRLRDTAVPIVLAAPAGVSARTILWAVDVGTHRIGFHADEEQPAWEALVQTNEALAVGYLDHVKVQFELDHLLLVRGSQGRVLQASMPHVVHRFQRRDSFRVRPGAGGPTCTMRHPSIPDMRLELRIVDLSVGGCSLLMPSDMPELRPGLVLYGVQVELDPATAFVAGIELHHIASMDGEGGQRIGCAWQGLDPIAERALQCYVNQTQKQQRLQPGP